MNIYCFHARGSKITWREGVKIGVKRKKKKKKRERREGKELPWYTQLECNKTNGLTN